MNAPYDVLGIAVDIALFAAVLYYGWKVAQLTGIRSGWGLICAGVLSTLFLQSQLFLSDLTGVPFDPGVFFVSRLLVVGSIAIGIVIVSRRTREALGK